MGPNPAVRTTIELNQTLIFSQMENQIYTTCLNHSLSPSVPWAIHHVENGKRVNKWPISAAASVSIYNVGGGAL